MTTVLNKLSDQSNIVLRTVVRVFLFSLLRYGSYIGKLFVQHILHFSYLFRYFHYVIIFLWPYEDCTRE